MTTPSVFGRLFLLRGTGEKAITGENQHRKRRQQTGRTDPRQQTGPAREPDGVHANHAPGETGIVADGKRHERDANERNRDSQNLQKKDGVHNGLPGIGMALTLTRNGTHHPKKVVCETI